MRVLMAFGAFVLLIVVVAGIMSAPDVKRYVEISTM